MTSRPDNSEFASSFAGYVALVPETDVLAVLQDQITVVFQQAALVAADRERYRYGAGKWSIREVFGHLVDAERVFGYRAFCISRWESVSLPSFEENDYVKRSRYDECPLKDLVTELKIVREGNLSFLRFLDNSAWEHIGTANNHPVSVRALAYIMAGHVRHHFKGLHDNYGVPAAR